MKNKNSHTSGPKKSSAGRSIPDIFDLVFKRLIRLSPGAVIRFINGLFGASHPPDSSVDYPGTETVSRRLRHLLSDTVFVIDGAWTYHIEAQITGDTEIAIRVFEYGFAQALRTKTTSGNLITVKFPEARIIYLDPRGNTPDEVTLRLEFPGGGCDYKVKTFKLLEHSTEELEEKNMFLLLPFYVLKLRRETEKAKTPGRRKILAREMKDLLKTILDATERGMRAGSLSKTDGQMIMEYMERLYQEVYMGYIEFKESDMIVKGMLLTYSEEVALKTRRKTRREDAKRYREREKKVIERTVLKTAKKMKELNLPADQIAAVSGLSLDEITKL
jgi:hypothetical protein